MVIIKVVNLIEDYNTVKHGYSEHAYKELKLTAKYFSFPLTL